MNKTDSMKTLVLVGGGLAHLPALTNVKQFNNLGWQVKLITPSEWLYYSGMSARLLSGEVRTEDLSINLKQIANVNRVKFIEHEVRNIDTANNNLFLQTGEQVHYDLLSLAIGNEVDDNHISGIKSYAITVKPAPTLIRIRDKLHRQLIYTTRGDKVNIVVVGAGLSGTEIMGQLSAKLFQQSARNKVLLTLIEAKEKILPGYPSRLSNKVAGIFVQREVKIVTQQRIISVNKQTVKSDSREFPYDILVWATGMKASDIFVRSGMVCANDGSLLVNNSLQVMDRDNIFAAGDCITFNNSLPLPKTGVYAIKQGTILLQNLIAKIKGNSLADYKPDRFNNITFLLGDNTGVFCRGKIYFVGMLPELIKKNSDEKFVKSYRR